MSFQDLILSSLSNLQADGDLRGAFQHIINSGITVNNNDSKWNPPVDIVESNDNLYIYVELPGVVENSIGIDFFNNKVSISGEKIKQHKGPVYKYEIVYGKFNRQINIPLSVTNQENVNVKYENGVLVLIIDKKKEEQHRFCLGVNKNQNKDI